MRALGEVDLECIDDAAWNELVGLTAVTGQRIEVVATPEGDHVGRSARVRVAEVRAAPAVRQLLDALEQRLDDLDVRSFDGELGRGGVVGRRGISLVRLGLNEVDLGADERRRCPERPDDGRTGRK